jgi:hypothetical protein
VEGARAGPTNLWLNHLKLSTCTNNNLIRNNNSENGLNSLDSVAVGSRLFACCLAAQAEKIRVYSSHFSQGKGRLRLTAAAYFPGGQKGGGGGGIVVIITHTSLYVCCIYL